MLAGFKFNVSHQEIERILSEVEAWYECASEQAGVEWMPMEGIVNFLFNDLGYEDMDEFEDAIQGTFPDFLAAFPHIETKRKDPDPTKEDEAEKWLIKVHKSVPGKPRKLTLRISTTKQLVDTTFLKALDATVSIPHLEFEIGADAKRKIDSIYNHVVIAHENLNDHAKMLGEDPAQKASILETVAELFLLLDVEKPFDLVVIDPRGLSEFKPSEGVIIEDLTEDP